MVNVSQLQLDLILNKEMLDLLNPNFQYTNIRNFPVTVPMNMSALKLRELSGTQSEEARVYFQAEVKRIESEINLLIQPPVFTYNYQSIYGTFTTQAPTEAQAYQMFQAWLRQKESEVTPEPEPPALLSASIKISFTNSSIGEFSSSIPLDDIGQLQALSNSSPDWKYNLIRAGINQPILSLNELINNINNLLANVEPTPEPPAGLLSANIKISFTNLNIGGFSTSIPIDDIGQLQALSNSAPEWKYTLIDSSTNAPLTTLNKLIITINDLLPNITITDNMVTQQVINFNIVNGRAVGSIKFVATNNFNPHYFNKPIVNIIQIKDPNGVKNVGKQNPLNFTETERDEVLNFDEDVKGNTRATVESFVWLSATQPTAFSKMGSWDISETEPPKPISSGFMAQGVAGAIAGLVLLGFIVDSKRGK